VKPSQIQEWLAQNGLRCINGCKGLEVTEELWIMKTVKAILQYQQWQRVLIKVCSRADHYVCCCQC